MSNDYVVFIIEVKIFIRNFTTFSYHNCYDNGGVTELPRHIPLFKESHPFYDI